MTGDFTLYIHFRQHDNISN